MFRCVCIFLFYSVALPCNAATISAYDKIIAVKYMSSKTFPESVKACTTFIPSKADLYKTTLEEWLSANNQAISKGKEIFNDVLQHEEGSEDEIFSKILDGIKMEFSQLSEPQKNKRCEYILEVMKNER